MQEVGSVACRSGYSYLNIFLFFSGGYYSAVNIIFIVVLGIAKQSLTSVRLLYLVILQ